MFEQNGQRHIKAYIAAVEQLADPHRKLMADDRPCVVVLGGTDIDYSTLASLAKGSDEFDADLLYLEFNPGSEHEGPTRIRLALTRNGIVYTWSDCAIFADPRGRPCLVSNNQGRYGVATFDPDGIDYRPGRPKTSIPKGLKRGQALLCRLAANKLHHVIAANDHQRETSDVAA